MKWLRRTIWLLLIVAVLTPCVLYMTGSSIPLSGEKITLHAKRLNEAAAIQIPHFYLMETSDRASHRQLLERVESGEPLTEQESVVYRKLFQKVLQESQSFLGRFDSELTVLQNVAMEQSNNIGSTGIAGFHDHHDVSARKNYADLENAVLMAESATGMFGFLTRIRSINLAQKSLADIISHMGVAPHTVSVGNDIPDSAWRDGPLSGTFEELMRSYKMSQFELVNSDAYWQHVRSAIANYARLIEQTQTRLWNSSASWEQRIAGRFQDRRTLAPQIDENIPLRRPD